MLHHINDGFYICTFISHHSFHYTVISNFSCDLSCIDICDCWNIFHFQEFIQTHITSEIAWFFTIFFNNESKYIRNQTFKVITVDPAVSNGRICHHNDLSIIRQITQDFLVSTHTRLENQFSHLVIVATKSNTFINTSIF